MRRGLTLSEVIVALGLVSLVALGLLAAFISGNKMMAQSKSLSMATDVARETLEAIKYDGYSGTVIGTFDGRVPTPSDISTGFPHSPYPAVQRGQTEYRTLVRVSQYATELRLVEVQVFWESGRHSTKMATMLHL